MIDDSYLMDMVSHLITGTRGTFVYIGSNADQAKQAKALFVGMIAGKQSYYIARMSTKQEYATDAQRFLFTSTKSILLGALRGTTINIAYMDISPEDRTAIQTEILPAITSSGGKVL